MIEEWEKSKKQGESPKDFIRKGYLGPAIPNMIEEWEKAEKQGVNFVDFVRKQTKENLPLYAEIAPIDFQRMVTNIIENARRHAFIDPSRDDYYIGIDLSLDNKRGMYQIDFSNNGNPLPEGMTKERYGIRGEKVGTTAGTGSGGYIIKSIVNHYGGDYDVFTKDGITTIRIYLPIASKV
jgi:signal transduction histidine kinase